MFKALLATVFVLLFASSFPAFSSAVNFDRKSIQIALDSEPPDLNSLKATDQVSFFVIEHVMEGLLAYDEKGGLIPGIAERWELSETGANFYLRKNARWSDGVPVTAHDFVFAWQTAVNPKTASRYAFILSPVKNAERISEGKLSPDHLGVKAIDDYTLKVEFERSCAYFLSLTTFGTYFPVREDFYKKNEGRYFADVENMIFNGPYVLSEWVHGASLKLKKNPDFWNANAINLNEINVPYITADANVKFNLFANDEIVFADLNTDTIKPALQERVKINKFSSGAIFFINFNHREGRLTTNKNLRKAIQHVVDASDIVNKVVGVPGNKTLYSVFPSWLEGENKRFNKEYPPKKYLVDFQKAQAYLEKAKQELELEEIPPLVLLSSEKPSTQKRAEYLQALLKETLGLEIKIDKQIFKQRLKKMSSGEFDIALAAWGPDYNDPSTFGDLFYSKNSNNHGRYSNPEYDRWVEVAMNNTNKTTRMQAFAKMQNMIGEEAIIIPQFERGIVFVESTEIKNIVRRIFGGDPSFRFAYLDEPNK
jgi:oligopeptide transport system substrate-binding protein